VKNADFREIRDFFREF